MTPSGSRQRALEAVTEALRAYAERGVFRGFGSRSRRGGGLEYRFRWLTERPFVLCFDPARARLTFADLLPAVPPRSRLDRDLRRFLVGRSDAGLPNHRRLDPARLRVECRNRKGSVSISVSSLDGDWPHAVRKSVALANEIFLSFLAGPYEEYMVREFETPEE